MLSGRRVLLIIGGGIAAYKALELIRLIQKAGGSVTPVLTRAGAEFVTPLSVGALAGAKVFQDLFDLTDEAEMGHIQLSRACQNATDKRVLVAPAMNVRMWDHPATRRNLATLRADGVLTVGPDEGEMACGEYGPGRMAEPAAIVAAIGAAFGAAFGGGPLAGRHVIVTSGPTHEPIDPVRYIANRSSGAQGTALAAALRDLGARVTFVTGPAVVPPPAGVAVVRVETAREMAAAVEAALPADAAVMAAAVADWRVANASGQKLKKDGSGKPPALEFAENPDILAVVSKGKDRPRLVIGFAAETTDVVAHATAKRARKGCDWIVANDVSGDVMGGAHNQVSLVTAEGVERWPRLPKDEVAGRLADRIATALQAPVSAPTT
jgi:phosphopantothenoylcysteine decarboxylase / phosphopantothenate---cysteine ligase